MTEIIDAQALRDLIDQQRLQMAKFNSELDAVNAKLAGIESEQNPDRGAVTELRAEFDRIMTAANEFTEQTNQRISALKDLMRPNLPSA